MGRDGHDACHSTFLGDGEAGSAAGVGNLARGGYVSRVSWYFAQLTGDGVVFDDIGRFLEVLPVQGSEETVDFFGFQREIVGGRQLQRDVTAAVGIEFFHFSGHDEEWLSSLERVFFLQIEYSLGWGGTEGIGLDEGRCL